MTSTSIHTRIQFGLSLLLLIFGVAACTPETKYTLFNNTDSPIVIRLDQKTYAIQKGAYCELENWYADSVSIETATKKWSYSLHLPAFHELTVNNAYNEQAFSFSKPEFGAKRITIQVNADGKVFIVPSEAKIPIPANTVQPNGFPLSPTGG